MRRSPGMMSPGEVRRAQGLIDRPPPGRLGGNSVASGWCGSPQSAIAVWEHRRSWAFWASRRAWRVWALPVHLSTNSAVVGEIVVIAHAGLRPGDRPRPSEGGWLSARTTDSERVACLAETECIIVTAQG